MSEQLIYALSSIGQVSFDQFNEIFKKLYLPGNSYDEELPDINVRSLSLRVLESLGYCEIDYDKRKIYMCPPSLVLLPSSALPHALLTGARTPGFIEKIKRVTSGRREMAVYNRTSQKNQTINLPDSVSIETTDTDTLKGIADKA
ncbi:MAG: hypothetical protein U9R43_15415, partial [Thermodesulfobacteriota bacterium]|nr:hypothetical protein [Thermodesulfobacteriota bacterium]